MHFTINSKFIAIEKFSATISFTNSILASHTYNIAKTGYTPIGIVSMNIGGNVAAFPYAYDFSTVTNNAWVYLRTYNNSALTADVTVAMNVLYKKTT